MGNINEWSFQRFARFFGFDTQKDEEFENKINTIEKLLEEDKLTDLNEIAEKSGCSYDECIVKIMYLKNKRRIEEYYIDKINGIIQECTKEDLKLIEKYTSYIYGKHCQIREMVLTMPGVNINNLEDKINETYNEIEYLYDKNLLNGIILNKVDKTIKYYHLEKHKNENNLETLNCPNCGALVDVNIGSKEKCRFCDTIVESKKKVDFIS